MTRTGLLRGGMPMYMFPILICCNASRRCVPGDPHGIRPHEAERAAAVPPTPASVPIELSHDCVDRFDAPDPELRCAGALTFDPD